MARYKIKNPESRSNFKIIDTTLSKQLCTAYYINDAKTIEEAASKLSSAKVESRKIILTETSLVLGQQDPLAVAYAFTTKEGATSAPIKGDLGVYMIKVNSRATTSAAEDLSAQRNEINAKHRNNVEQGYLMALYRAADVNDWRMKRKISNVTN